MNILALAAEAVSRIRDIREAYNAVSPEGEGRDTLEMRIEDACALAQDLEEAVTATAPATVKDEGNQL